MSMRRSGFPESHQSRSPPTAYPRQVHGLDSEPIIRRVDPKPTTHPEQKIAHQPPATSYRTPSLQFSTDTHPLLPHSAPVTSNSQRQQNDFVAPHRSQGQRNTATVSQSFSPELLGVAGRVSQTRKERDVPRYILDGSSEQIHQQKSTSSRLQPTESNRSATCFVSPTLPSISYLDIMYSYDSEEPKLFLKFLGSLTMYEYKQDSKRLTVTKFAHGHDPKLYNEWLLSLLPVSGKEIQTFRSLTPPKDYDYSLLARCIRFTLSPVEKIALIMERTDEYGQPRTDEREMEEKLKNRRIIDGMKGVFALVRPAESFEEYLWVRQKRVVKK
jgi:hypothetical protein